MKQVEGLVSISHKRLMEKKGGKFLVYPFFVSLLFRSYYSSLHLLKTELGDFTFV